MVLGFSVMHPETFPFLNLRLPGVKSFYGICGYTFIFSSQSQVVPLETSFIACFFPCCPEGEGNITSSNVLAKCFHRGGPAARARE